LQLQCYFKAVTALQKLLITRDLFVTITVIKFKCRLPFCLLVSFFLLLLFSFSMFYYFGSNVKGQYYFQSKWIKDVTDFEDSKYDTEYCTITMTTSTANEYWQSKGSYRKW
jgi:hypothetical protein